MVNSLSGNKTGVERNVKYWTCSMHPQIKLPRKDYALFVLWILFLFMHGSDKEDEGSEVSLILNEVGQKLAEIEQSKCGIKKLLMKSG